MAKHCLTLGELDRERVADIDRKVARTKRNVDVRSLPRPASMAEAIDAIVTQQPSKTYPAMTAVA